MAFRIYIYIHIQHTHAEYYVYICTTRIALQWMMYVRVRVRARDAHSECTNMGILCDQWPITIAYMQMISECACVYACVVCVCVCWKGDGSLNPVSDNDNFLAFQCFVPFFFCSFIRSASVVYDNNTCIIHINCINRCKFCSTMDTSPTNDNWKWMKGEEEYWGVWEK